MKARHVLMVLFLMCFSCGTPSISDSEKGKIQKEVKEVVNTIIEAAKAANSEIVIQQWIDSPDFAFTFNAKSYGYNEISNANNILS